MNSKTLILFLIVWTAATASASAQTSAARPVLLVFTGPGPFGGPCIPCESVKSALAMNAGGLRTTLQRSVDLRPYYDYRNPRHRPVFQRWNIQTVPTFIVATYDGQEIGHEIGRVVGYRAATFLAEINNAGSNRFRTRPPATRPPPPPPVDDRAERFSEANEFLEQKADALEQRLDDRQQQGAAERERAKLDASAAAEQIERLKTDHAAELDRLAQPPAPPATPPAAKLFPIPDPISTPADCVDGVCPVPPITTTPTEYTATEPSSDDTTPPPTPARGVVRSVLHHLAGVAVDVGFSAGSSLGTINER